MSQIRSEANKNTGAALVLGVFVMLGLIGLGYFLGDAAMAVKQLDRSVTVKGLAERELPADIVIWPIQFNVAGNDLQALYNEIDEQTALIRAFLTERGIAGEEISVATPSITDKSAQQYAGNGRAEFRYSAFQTVTVYSEQVMQARAVMNRLSELGKAGIVFTGDNYAAQTEYIFTRLNDIKPQMIEEATIKAREVAAKFAEDSHSRLGKIKRASQGQFSISPRDKNNPHIKKVRVVSTVEYYLAD